MPHPYVLDEKEVEGVREGFPELLQRLARCHKNHVEEKENLRRQVCHLSGEVSLLRSMLAQRESTGHPGRSSKANRRSSGKSRLTWISEREASVRASQASVANVDSTLSETSDQIKKLSPLERWAVLSSNLLWGKGNSQFGAQDSEQNAYELLTHWSLLSESRDNDVSFGLVTLQVAKTVRNSGRISHWSPENSWLQRLVMSPTCWQRLVWCMIGVVLLTWDALMIPMQVFSLGSFGDLIRSVAIGTSVYWVLDVPLHCLVAFQNPDGSEECRPLQITRHYARTWLPLDISILMVDGALFSMDVLLMEYEDSANDSSLLYAGRSLRLARLVRLLRLVRLMRLRKLNELMSAAVFRIKSEHLILGMKLAKHVGMILLVNHYIACTWYALADYNDGLSWLTEYAGQDSSTGHVYIMALHWSMTQFSPATNNIAPQNWFERVFAVCVVLFALISFSSFISSVTNTVNQLRTLNLEPQMEEVRIREFLFCRRVSPDLVGRILNFFKQNYRWRKQRIRENDIAFFKEVPESLKIRMHEETYMPIISASPFFHTFVDLGRPLLVQVCHTAFSELFFLPQQDVFVDGTPASGVYFIASGCLTYSYHRLADAEMATREVSEGDWITEMCLVIKWHHCGQLCARTSTEIVKLDKVQFNAIVSKAGGPLVECLRRYAVFILGHIESMTILQPVTDISMGADCLKRLGERARKLWQLQTQHITSESGESVLKGAGFLRPPPGGNHGSASGEGAHFKV